MDKPASQLPTRIGYWWLLPRGDTQPSAVWVQLVDYEGTGTPLLCYDNITARVLLPVDEVDGEWQGPALPPCITRDVEQVLGLYLRSLEGKMGRDAIRQRRVCQTVLRRVRVGHTWKDE